MKGTILIVDDDPNALKLMGYTLQAEGYATVTAQTGTEALIRVKESPPDLVILDVMMPDMSGIEVCRHLRSNPDSASLPILMLSAKGQVEDKVTGLKAGADDYVAKPVDLAELLARVEALLLRASRTMPPPPPRAQMVAFLGAKGGVGTTTVAVNMALSMVQQGQTVTLADLHPHYLASVCPMLGLQPPHGLTELAQMEAQEIRPRDVESRLFSHFTGLRVLSHESAPATPEPQELTSAHVEAILDGLSGLAEWVFLDLPGYPTLALQAALNRCDTLTLVVEPDPLALGCARNLLGSLQRWGIMGEMVGVVVVNRSPSTMTLTVNELRERLEAPIVGVIPPAVEACVQALRRATPLLLGHPAHLASETLQGLAQRLREQSPRVNTTRGLSLLSRR